MDRGRAELMRFYGWIRRNPYNFARACGVESLTDQHLELFDAVASGAPKIATRSGQGPGKTFCSSMIGLWRSIRFQNSKLIVTAPTMGQCRDVWLAQAQKHIEGPTANPLLRRIFQFTGTGYGVFGNRQKVWGCMLKTASNPDNMRGQHAEDMDIIVEEASGCEDEILDILDGTQTNKNGLFLMIGNPSRREGFFFDAFHAKREKWVGLHWNAEKTPDSKWFNQAKNKEKEEKYGRDSDYYRVNVLGEFPSADPDSVIPEDKLRWCMERNSLATMGRIRRDGEILTQIGLDFARMGSDESAIAYRRGNAVFRLDQFVKTEPIDVVRSAFAKQRQLAWTDAETLYVPDSVGIGQGVLHAFYDAGKNVREFHPLNPPANQREYANAETEAWFGLREKVRKGIFWMPSGMAYEIAVRQLATRKYGLNRRCQVEVESKEKYKERGYPSPDRADAIVSSMYDGARAFARIG